MSNYKVGDKVVLTVTSKVEEPSYSYYILNNDAVLLETTMNEDVKPLSTYTEALEDKINRQAKEITRLLAKNKELKVKLEYEESKPINLETGRIAGQHEAWELARKITCQPINGGFNRSEFEEIFNEGYISDVFKKYTYSEAAAKVAKWKKAEEEIKVGDVLEDIYDSNVKCIVTNLYPNNMVHLVFYDGTAGMDVLDNFKKTGRHIDIDGFLKQIGEQE